MKNDSPITRRKYLVFATLLLIFLGVNEIYFRDTIFDFSVDFIQTLQTKIDTAVFRYPFQIISAFANPIFIIVVFVILFILPTDKVLLVKLSMYVIFMGYILAIIKTLYGDPRPYWVSPDDSDLPNYSAPGIKPLETYAEYGNPSGHLFFTMAFYGYLYYLYIRANPERGAVNENLLRGNLSQADQANSWEEDPTFDLRLSAVYRLSIVPKKDVVSHTKLNIFCFFFVISVAFARMYLGMHALNQVILGFALGSYYLFLTIKYIDPAVDEPLRKLFNNQSPNKPIFRWVLTLCYFVLTMIPVIIYIIQNATNPVGSSIVWTQWWPVVTAELNNTPAAFAYIRCFLDAAVLGGLFGLMYAVLGFENSYSYPTTRLFQITWKRFILRALVMIIMIGVPAAILFFIPFGAGSFILQYFINHNCAIFAATYIMVKYVPMVYARYGLEMPGDFEIPVKTKPTNSIAETNVGSA